MRVCALPRITVWVLVLWPALAAAQTPAECARNSDKNRWFVRAGAAGEASGTRDRPFGSLAEIERCSPAGATITVLPAPGVATPLDGGIRLKDRQKLLGQKATIGQPPARLTNSTGTGDGVTLAHGNEVAHLHIESPSGAAIFGDNVNGAFLHDLLVTRRLPTAPSRLDGSLCRVVRTGEGVDNAQSVLRGCTARQVASVKHGIMLLADDRAGAASIKYSLQRVVIRDNPSHERPEVLWPVGVSVNAAGHVAVMFEMLDSSIEFTGRGVVVRSADRAVVTATVTNTWFDSLRSDGFGLVTGFACSGLDGSVKIPDCSTLSPAPVSDARIVLNADRFRFTDTRRHGQPNDPAAIEPIAYDQGRSTIEVHVQRSDMIGSAALAMFTFYVQGRPASDVMDLGCVNPAPGATAPDRDACRRLGYTSVGQNRIFGNVRNSKSYSPYVDVALQGPGRMLAQGNYWGDVKPVDGKGDAFGECTVFDWSDDPKDYSPPFKPVPDSRCELYNHKIHGNPSGIDGRFHLAADPRPPK